MNKWDKMPKNYRKVRKDKGDIKCEREKGKGEGKGKGKREKGNTKDKKEKEKENGKCQSQKGKGKREIPKSKGKRKREKEILNTKGKEKGGKLTFSFPILQGKGIPVDLCNTTQHYTLDNNTLRLTTLLYTRQHYTTLHYTLNNTNQNFVYTEPNLAKKHVVGFNPTILFSFTLFFISVYEYTKHSFVWRKHNVWYFSFCCIGKRKLLV